MKKHSKRYQKVNKKIEKKYYPLREALTFCLENKLGKIIKADFKIKQSNKTQKKSLLIKDMISLPHTVERKGKIAIIGEKLPNELTKNEKVELIKMEDVKERIENKKRNQWGFEKLVAPTEYETNLKPLAKLLGAKGILPSTKSGTLTDNLSEAVKIWENEREIKIDKDGNIHFVLGKTDFSLDQLEENYQTLYNKVKKLRPQNWKGDFIDNITLSTTMGPGIKTLI